MVSIIYVLYICMCITRPEENYIYNCRCSLQISPCLLHEQIATIVKITNVFYDCWQSYQLEHMSQILVSSEYYTFEIERKCCWNVYVWLVGDEPPVLWIIHLDLCCLLDSDCLMAGENLPNLPRGIHSTLRFTQWSRQPHREFEGNTWNHSACHLLAR